MKIDKKSWQEGYEAGLRHQDPQPENTDVLSWHGPGFLKGRQRQKKMKVKIHKEQLRRKTP